MAEVGLALGAGRGADDPESGLRLLLADLREGVEEGHQVFGGFDTADPGQRVGGRAVRGLADLGEAGGVHARVDRAELGTVGSAALLPAAGVRVAGGDDRGPVVELGRESAVESGEEGAHGGWGVRRGEVVRAQADSVLGQEHRYAEEVVGEQGGQGCWTARGCVTEVDRAEAVVLVPVEREGAQGAFQVCGDREEIRYARLARRLLCALRTTGALQGAYGGLRAECAHQAALVPGQFGEAVQRAGETVRLSGRRSLRGAGTTQRGRQLAVALGEPPTRPAPVHHAVLLGRPQRRRAHPADLRRQREPALVLLALAAAERVDVELVPPEPAHEPVAPEPGVTAHIRIATLRKQSDAHVRTPDLPFGEPPLTRRLAAGRTYADKAVARRTVVHRATKRGERS